MSWKSGESESDVFEILVVDKIFHQKNPTLPTSMCCRIVIIYLVDRVNHTKGRSQRFAEHNIHLFFRSHFSALKFMRCTSNDCFKRSFHSTKGLHSWRRPKGIRKPLKGLFIFALEQCFSNLAIWPSLKNTDLEGILRC